MDSELKYLLDQMNKNLEMRHSKMMFAFTTVIAAMAIIFNTGSDDSSWICVLAYVILIPFQARTSHSGLSHARMEAYILVNYKDQVPYLRSPVGELDFPMGKFIGFLTNCELLFLTLAVDGIFYYLTPQTGIMVSLRYLVPVIFWIGVGVAIDKDDEGRKLQWRVTVARV